MFKFITTTVLIAAVFSTTHSATAQPPDNEIQLIVRSDDMGAAHAVNEACLESVNDGIARSIEVLVPAPWFLEAAEMLKKHPKIDVGVHLDLTSEWSKVKWGPVSKNVPSLVDVNGHFYPMTSQRKDWPANTGFLESGWKLAEVERELRAQIETAQRHLPNVTHLSAHMGTATSTPELRTLVNRLAEEYKLPLNLPNARRTPGFGGSQTTAEEKETALIKMLEELKPGVWLFVEHPGLDTPEMRAIGHKGYENVAADRAGVTHALTSEKVKAVVRKRGIKLVSYADVIEINRQRELSSLLEQAQPVNSRQERLTALGKLKDVGKSDPKQTSESLVPYLSVVVKRTGLDGRVSQRITAVRRRRRLEGPRRE